MAAQQGFAGRVGIFAPLRRTFDGGVRQVPPKVAFVASAAVTDFGEWGPSVQQQRLAAAVVQIGDAGPDDEDGLPWFRGPKLSGSWNGSAGYTSTAGGVGFRFAVR